MNTLGQSMTDLKHKARAIQQIEKLQLNQDFIDALDHAQHAAEVLYTLDVLAQFELCWN